MTNYSIGQNIKRLRKERALTQEELAELIGVSAQAISKWENENGLPDISQIVPLASVFGVPTDDIFGIQSIEENARALEIVDEASSLYEYGNPESYLKVYERLMEGLKKYPRNGILLNRCLGQGLALCLPENGDMYLPEHAKRISAEAKHQAELIIAYSKNLPDILSAHSALVLLYSAEGAYEKALSAANDFPVRADLTVYSNRAAVYSRMEEYSQAEKSLCSNIDYTLQALEDSAANLGKAYFRDGKYESAIEVYETVLGVFDVIFKDSPRPPYHDFDSGDCYLLLAEAYLKTGDSDKAMQNIEKSVKYYVELLNSMKGGKIAYKTLANSPLIQETELNDPVMTEKHIVKKLHEKLSHEWMNPLRKERIFHEICRKVGDI